MHMFSGAERTGVSRLARLQRAHPHAVQAHDVARRTHARQRGAIAKHDELNAGARVRGVRVLRVP